MEIKEDPYNFICNWIEDILPYAGRRVFEILSLMPPSLILPDLQYKENKIRSNINVLLLAPPSSGKSSICNEFSYLTYFPLEVESITPARLETEISSNPNFSLIVGDFFRMATNPIILKIIENILGEEKSIRRATMRKTIDTETNGIGLMCGTSQDLNSYLSGGFIFRTVPIIIVHNEKEHSEIGKKINEEIGGNKSTDNKRDIIKDYYKELFLIQNKKQNQITGYNIKKEFRDNSFKLWDSQTKRINQIFKAPFNWFREMQEFYRFLIAHSFLNYFNRKVENGILYPNEEDYKVAINLMNKTIKLKFDIISMSIYSKTISNLKELARIMESERLSEERKHILQNLVNLKK